MTPICSPESVPFNDRIKIVLDKPYFIIVILAMQNLGLGKGDLIRNLPIETRILHRENSLKQYKVATNKKITGKEMVVMI